ncbi:hypothetical protein D3C81_1612020 [compost metagenome]
MLKATSKPMVNSPDWIRYAPNINKINVPTPPVTSIIGPNAWFIADALSHDFLLSMFMASK